MKKKILVLAGLLSLATIAVATLSSYGSVIGYATVEKSMYIDIIGSSNDESYDLKSVHQGGTDYSPKIKLKNQIDEDVQVNILFEVTEGSGDAVTLWVVDETKNVTLTNPITVPSEDMYVYIAHEFEPDATIGNYTFKIDVTPV